MSVLYKCGYANMDDGIYYNRDGNTRSSQAMRDFHNYIKRKLITSVSLIFIVTCILLGKNMTISWSVIFIHMTILLLVIFLQEYT